MDEKEYTSLIEQLRARIHQIRKTIEPSNNKESKEEAKLEETKIPETQEYEEYTLQESSFEESQPLIIIASKKQEIKEHIKKILYEGQQPTILLKQRVVDQEKKCSKASFYRYIQELKEEQQILKIQVADKEYCVLTHTGQ